MADGLAADAAPDSTPADQGPVRGQWTELAPNGAWSWFMDPRAIIDHGRLLVGSVRAEGRFADQQLPGWGDVQLSVLELATGRHRTVVLHGHFEQDDHDSPAFLVLADGRYLAVYSRHSQETRFYTRISVRPADPYEWGPESEISTPGVPGRFGGDSVTYANPIRLSAEDGRLYLFHRGVGTDPNYLVSEDDGRSWRYGGRLFRGRPGYSPYAKYASDGRDTIHFVATENHPRNYDNSLYHGFLRAGLLHRSDGSVVGALSTRTNTGVAAWDFTRIYQGGPSNVAWMTDIRLDETGRPVVLFTVQRDGAGLPMGAGGMDHRFHYARWNGTRWKVHEIACAGNRLYPGEDDYTGLGAIDPRHPAVVYISTDADPATGRPLISRSSYRRQHELFRGQTADEGATWKWTAITSNSPVDNLRPLVPASSQGERDDETWVVWMCGAYLLNRGEWTTRVVGVGP